jgi:hypothetical protein
MFFSRIDIIFKLHGTMYDKPALASSNYNIAIDEFLIQAPASWSVEKMIDHSR